MSTPRAKRALNMGYTPVAKRTRLATRATARVYSSKPEMKFRSLAITHAATTASNLDLTNIPAGSGVGDRVGAKVKFWNIDVIGAVNGPMRIDIVIPQITNSLPGYAATDQIDYREGQVLGTYIRGNTYTAGTSELFHWNLKLPVGVVSKWDGDLGSTIQKHQIICRVTSNASVTVTGNVRVSYTDF